MALWNMETMTIEKTILDEIRDIAVTRPPYKYPYGNNLDIYIEPDSDQKPVVGVKAPDNEYLTYQYRWISSVISVGEKWFSEEQWAKLMVMRLNGDIIIEKQGNGRLYIKEKNKWNDVQYYGGYVPPPIIQRPIWLDEDRITYKYSSSSVDIMSNPQPIVWSNISA